MHDLICLGELLIDMICPDDDVSLADAPRFVRAPGGAPANVAVAARRLGLATAFIGCVGDDPFGDFLARVLADHDVDSAGLRRADAARTTLAFIATRSDGSKDVAFHRHPGADMLLRAEDLDTDALARARALHFCSVSLSASPAREATLAAARIAADAGALVSFDPNWRPRLWPDAATARPLIDAGLALADVAKVSVEELDVVCGTTDVDTALEKLLAAGPRLAVVSRGERGAVAATAGARADLPGHAVDAVDPTGAGDAFVGALLAGLLAPDRLPDSGDPLDLDAERLAEVLAFANAAGALATTQHGAMAALPTAEAVEAFLAQVRAQ